jgi:hypothetical protein
MTEHYDYRAGTDVVVEMGAMRAFGRRILVRSIFGTDAYRGKLHVVQHNSTDADCFQVLHVGLGVAKWCEEQGEIAPKVGQHIDCRSTAADRVAQKDPTGRYWLVPVEDVTGVWDPIPVDERLISVIDSVIERVNGVSIIGAPSNGEVELVPR